MTQLKVLSVSLADVRQATDALLYRVVIVSH